MHTHLFSHRSMRFCWCQREQELAPAAS